MDSSALGGDGAKIDLHGYCVSLLRTGLVIESDELAALVEEVVVWRDEGRRGDGRGEMEEREDVERRRLNERLRWTKGL